MLSNLLNEMRENLRDFKDHPQRDWLMTYILEKDNYFYLNSIQDKNRLSDDEVVIISRILKQIGYIRYDNVIRFNIIKFFKKYKELK